MYPGADIPVTQLSIQFPLGPAHHVAVGRALEPLRAENVLILASGTATHNLMAMQRGRHNEIADWALAFDDWLVNVIEDGDEESFVDYRRKAPFARLAHPRDEHLLPIYVAYGAGGPNGKGRRIHRSYAHGTLSMAAFAFG
jgi:4,5-DOPA dioxygenase extradiol